MSRIVAGAVLAAAIWPVALPGQVHHHAVQHRASIRAVTQQFVNAWDHGDPQSMGAQFTHDADLIIPEGLVFRGRKNIAAFYTSVFQRGYKGSRSTGDIEQIRFVSNGVAIVDGAWSITGARRPDGKPRPAEHGVFSCVVVKRGGQWLITALREQTSATSLRPVSGP